MLIVSARKTAPRSSSCLRFSCARARPRGQRFRSGGAGIKPWGSFGARRLKPLAAGCLWRVCALAFPGGATVLFILGRLAAEAARGESWSPGLADDEARRRFPFLALEIGRWRSSSPNRRRSR